LPARRPRFDTSRPHRRRTSGQTASQEIFIELAVAVLHQCIRPLIGARTAPGHHGYQRACDLISGQTSRFVGAARPALDGNRTPS